MQGAVPALRNELEQRNLRLQADVDGSATGGARRTDEIEQGVRDSHAESETPALEDPHRQAPHPRRAEAGGPQPVPPVPGSQASARRVPQLRVLQGTSSEGGGGVVSG